MADKKTPLTIDGINESIYAGFWTRLGSLLLDVLIMLPYVFLVLYINGLCKVDSSRFQIKARMPHP